MSAKQIKERISERINSRTKSNFTVKVANNDISITISISPAESYSWDMYNLPELLSAGMTIANIADNFISDYNDYLYNDEGRH